MAFCNACGATLDAGTKFCSKCGAGTGVVVAAPAASGSPVAPAAPSQGGGALKIILIVAGVIVALGILGVGSLSFFAWRVAHRMHVRQDGNHVSVQTPFGSVESTKDPADVARNLGVDVYPGAQLLKEGAASATFGGIHSVTANFETSDPVDKVADFYKAKFPNAMVTTTDQGRCNIVSNEHQNLITLRIEPEGGTTKIHISSMTHKAAEGSSDTN